MKFSKEQLLKADINELGTLNSKTCWSRFHEIQGDFYEIYTYTDDRDRVDVYLITHRRGTKEHVFGIDPSGTYLYTSKNSSDTCRHDKPGLINVSDIEGSIYRVMGY